MVKRFLYLGIVLTYGAIVLFSTSCERDDICSEGTITTPSLVIEFFDATDTETAKNVTNLRVQGIGASDTFLASTTTNSITIPLKTQDTSTTFSLISGYEEDADGNQTAGNEDIITFNYDTEEIFLSRACGYITNFTITGIVVTPDSDNWIDPTTGIEIVNDTIQNETSVHVKIYH